jgi:2-methylfumaryl-CoA hydratase
MSKTSSGNYFEDFTVGRVFKHAAPRTITPGGVALYTSLYGTRFAVQSSDEFAKAINYPQAPVDDLMVFHIVFGKTVPDISLNAIANLGYADCRFLAPVYTGDTLHAMSEVLGVKETSKGDSGVVYVRSKGFNQAGDVVLDYVRWVLVRKRDNASPAPQPSVPTLPAVIAPDMLGDAVPMLDLEAWDDALSGASHRFGDYDIGEKIDHVDGMTIEEAEHMMATRLYQNTAKVHFNQFSEGKGRFGRRIVYGGHIISLARALSYNGLANAFHIAAINGGRHVAPIFAGDTIHAWSEVLDAQPITGRQDVGALRLRTVATKDLPCDGFPLFAEDGKAYAGGVVLDLDYWTLIPA